MAEYVYGEEKAKDLIRKSSWNMIVTVAGAKWSELEFITKARPNMLQEADMQHEKTMSNSLGLLMEDTLDTEGVCDFYVTILCL